MRRVGSYKTAITWIALNDDTDFLDDENCDDIVSVSCCLVADIFGRTTDEVIADLRKELEKES